MSAVAESLEAVRSAREAELGARVLLVVAMRRAALDGASTRVIGEAAGLSHARVAQLIREATP